MEFSMPRLKGGLETKLFVFISCYYNSEKNNVIFLHDKYLNFCKDVISPHNHRNDRRDRVREIKEHYLHPEERRKENGKSKY